MKILKILSSKLYLDSDEVLDISPDIIHQFKLVKGMDISGIYKEVLFSSIKEKAFFYLSLKPRTRYELNSKLKLKYRNDECINEVLEYMQENLYIDDVDFALSYILTHKNSRQKNTMKLMQRGVKKADIDLAYEDVPRDIQTDLIEEEVKKLIEKGFDNTQIIIKLTRKGYFYQDIQEVLKGAH